MIEKINPLFSLIPTDSNVLVLYSTCGAGHVIGAEVCEKGLSQQGHSGKIVTVNILTEALGKWFGNRIAKTWNEAQKKEHTWILRLLIRIQFLAEMTIFSLPIYLLVSKKLKEHKIDLIIDDQPNATTWILAAVKKMNRIRNKIGKKPIHCYKYMTDLPTPGSSHFYPRLSSSSKAIYTLVTRRPPLKFRKIIDKKSLARETERNYWKRLTGLDIDKGQVLYAPFPVRKAFLEWSKKDPVADQPRRLNIKINNEEEKQSFQCCLSGKVSCTPSSSNAVVPIDDKDKLYQINLGSQVARKAIFTYIDEIKKEVQKENNRAQKYFLAIFCSKHNATEKTLYKEVCEQIKKMSDMPANLCLLPLGQQSDEEIAPINFRTDKFYVRSGGLTTMELKHTAKRQGAIVNIHSPKGKRLFGKKLFTRRQLINAIPVWEGPNALYLAEKLPPGQVQFVTPYQMESADH